MYKALIIYIELLKHTIFMYDYHYTALYSPILYMKVSKYTIPTCTEKWQNKTIETVYYKISDM